MKERQRLLRECQEWESGPHDEVSAEMIDNDIYRWRGKIKGPVGSPYEGGVFTLDISIPPDYPYSPPKIKFITKVWHPNISSQTGAICLDILNKEWSPALTLRTVLISIQALLSNPVPDDPQDAQVAAMYTRDFQEFLKTAQMWTQRYAVDDQNKYQEKIKLLMEMGFDANTAKEALILHGGDEAAAINSLLG